MNSEVNLMSAARNTGERQRKLLIRSLLVSGTTVATLIGAQSLTWIDAARFAQTATPAQTATLAQTLQPQETSSDPDTIQQVTPSPAVQYSSPNLVVLRRPATHQPSQAQASQPLISAPSAASAPIQPPAPVVALPQPIVIEAPQDIQPPAPSIVSAPAPVVANSHSSR